MSDSKPRIVKCPTCGTAVEWRPENRFRPFCSARCKQIDLGAWAAEEYRVPTAPPDSNEDGQLPSDASSRP
ncbi:DNA gyrase inhibitor YacG [Azoarcus sp. DD4]|uniref:DNA gyrase inhibitor YacG n=1 Tax=Azoarcus sp. DD4 TaxID=2027405 RepID=UPI00112EC7E9|nr:DNA gyrase inhibitor YacG [Azoarcus sp. DD4]QDF95865.1 DNA gyrase inhibitor YacG [Azoarcus sp. DD4]